MIRQRLTFASVVPRKPLCCSRRKILMTNNKQYYITGKEYEWTAGTWESVVQARDFEESCTCGPFLQEGVDGKSCYRVNGVTYPTDLFLHWEFMGDEEYWHFTVNEEDVEIPECLIPFYGEKE